MTDFFGRRVKLGGPIDGDSPVSTGAGRAIKIVALVVAALFVVAAVTVALPALTAVTVKVAVLSPWRIVTGELPSVSPARSLLKLSG